MERSSGPEPRRRRADVNREINEHLARQAGTVGYRQLLDAGLTSRTVASRVRTGEFVRRSNKQRLDRSGRVVPGDHLVSGAYASHDGPLTLAGRRWAALHAAPPGSRISHLSACALHDLVRARGWIHVVHPGYGWVPPYGVVAHRTDAISARDCAEIETFPCTSVARSLLDAAADASAEDLDDLLDRAVEIQLYDQLDMQRVLAERPTVRGVDPLTEAIGRLDDKSGEFRSKFERRTTRLVQRSLVLPSPAVNVLADGYRPDLHFPGTRAIVECDGRDYHRSLAQILADEAREEVLRARGFEFLRLRWHHVVYEEDRTLDRIERFVLANLEPPVPQGRVVGSSWK